MAEVLATFDVGASQDDHALVAPTALPGFVRASRAALSYAADGCNN